MRTPAITKGRFAEATVLMLSLAASATAQAPLSAQPTETDLHAAYCTQALQTVVTEGESMLSSFSGPEYSTVPGPNDPPALRESKAKSAASTRASKAELESQKAMLRRLDLYLKPRIFDLNPMGLVAAKRAAQEDWHRIGSATASCQNECPLTLESDAITKCYTECSTRAMPDLPTIQKKLMSCLTLEWLPF
jgi:hypothetical protein